jgi:CheY-like chemotaxis protein
MHMPTAPVSTKNILVVEDEVEVTLLMELSLRRLPVKLHCVNDGEAALEWMRHHTPDLVVLDVMMPRMSGMAVYDAMLADDRLKKLPVLVVSVIYSDETLIRNSALAKLPSVRKPFSPVAFADRVRGLLGLPAEA